MFGQIEKQMQDQEKVEMVMSIASVELYVPK